MAAHSNLMGTPQERAQRSEEKRRQVLRFLRQEIWSSQDILGSVMGLASRTAAHKNLHRMEAEGLLRRHQVQGLGGGSVTLWGITPHGQGLAFELGTEEPLSAYFEPQRVAEQTIRHGLDLQRVRVRLEQAQWTGWQNGDRLTALLKGGKRPDAMVTSPSGERWAIEIERTIKTTKRYEQVLASYLQAIKAGEVDYVVWLCPSAALAARLQAIVCGIREVVIQRQRYQVDPQRHHAALAFYGVEDWPRGRREI